MLSFTPHRPVTRGRAPLALALASLALTSCASVADIPTERIGQASLQFANGVPAGSVQLLSNGNGVTVAVVATGLSQGLHGFHLHTVGKCKAPSFKSAGGHLNPFGKSHGSLSPDGKHLGDLPNLDAGSSGTATARFDIEGDSDAVIDEIFDADGTAVVIHAGPDDYRSDPAGDAGARIACGVLSRN